MTGYTVHTGSNEDFSSGWDRIFGGQDEPPKTAKAKSKKAAKAKTGGRKPAKKTGRKKK